MLLKYKPGEAPGILAQLFQDNVIEISSWYSWNYTVEKNQITMTFPSATDYNQLSCSQT